MKHNIIFVLSIFLNLNLAFSQSKKEQIELLNFKSDSLRIVLDGERLVYSSRVANLLDTISRLNQQVYNLNADVKNLTLDVDSLKERNDKLNVNLISVKSEKYDLKKQLIEKEDSLKLVMLDLQRYVNMLKLFNNDVPENNYDQYSSRFLKLGKDVSGIQSWINKIVLDDFDGDSSYVTPRCLKYINDATELAWGYDGSIDEATFNKKWNKFYDLKHASFGHMFIAGNGGWDSKKITSLDYLGELNKADWFKLVIQGGPSENDFSVTLVRVIKVIRINDRYYIDNFLSLSDE
jgi:hypothetical protein